MLHLRLRHHTSPSWLREANPACMLSHKTRSRLHSPFLKLPSASLYRHRVMYYMAAKIAWRLGSLSEYTRTINAYRHCTVTRQPIFNTRTPPGPLAGMHRLTDPIYEPPEAQHYNIPAPQLSQCDDGCVLMVTVSKETWRETQQG